MMRRHLGYTRQCRVVVLEVSIEIFDRRRDFYHHVKKDFWLSPLLFVKKVWVDIFGCRRCYCCLGKEQNFFFDGKNSRFVFFRRVNG